MSFSFDGGQLEEVAVGTARGQADGPGGTPVSPDSGE